MEGNDSETLGRNWDGTFPTLPPAFDIKSILGSLYESEGKPEQGHRQSRQGQGPSHRGQGQPGKGRGQVRPFQKILAHGCSQTGQDEGQSGKIQGPSNEGLGSKGQQGRSGEANGEAIKGHEQPGQGTDRNGTKTTQLGLAQTRPKEGQRQPGPSPGLSGDVRVLVGQGRGLPRQGLSQPRQSRCPLGKVQLQLGHTLGRQGQGQVGRGRDQRGQGSGETGQVQQGQAQRTLFEAQATTSEQHQPSQSALPPDGRKIQDHLTEMFNSMHCQLFKLNICNVRVDCDVDKKETTMRVAQETIDALQTSTREKQLEKEQLAVQLKDATNSTQELTAEITATREMCDGLQVQFSSAQQTLTKAEANQEEMKEFRLSVKAEMKTFAVTLSDLNSKFQNDKNIALAKVEAAVQEMGRAQEDFTNKSAIIESQVKEKSELLESKNEELKTTSQKLQDSIENCVGLEEITGDFQSRLEETQEGIKTLKLEINRRHEFESGLRAEIQNTERSYAEKEREHAARATELRRSCDGLHHKLLDLKVIFLNRKKENHELTQAACQRCSDEAEIRRRFEANIREISTEIDNVTIESDGNHAEHKVALESLDRFEQERASFQETTRQLEQQMAATRTLMNESESELNGMKAKDCALKNDLKDALKAVKLLESELCQQRTCNLDISNKIGTPLLENEELTGLFNHMTSQRDELNNIIEATKRNEDSLQFKVHELESKNRNRQDELESVKAHHQAQLGAYVQTCTNLVRELGKRREVLCEKVGCYENKYKDLGSEVDSLKRQGEQARSHESAELADYMEQIRRLEEAQSRRIAAEIENVKSGVERATQLKITEMSALVEEYKCDCDQQLEDKGNDCSSLERKYQDALENLYTVNEAQCDEMRAEMEKLKEALKQKTPPWLAPVTVAKSPYKGGILKPLATGEVVKRRGKVWYLSDSEGSEGSEIMDFTVRELGKRREALCEKVGCYENKYKDLGSEVDSLKQQGEQARSHESAELEDYMEQIRHLEEAQSRRIAAEIENVKSGVERATQLKITEMSALVEEYKCDCDQQLEDKGNDCSSLERKYQDALENLYTVNEAQCDEMRAEMEKLKEALKQKTPPWLAPVTVAKSPYKGGILKPLATGEVVKRRGKVWYLSDSEGSEGSEIMDFTTWSSPEDSYLRCGRNVTPPWLAPVTVAKSPYKGGILKPLATGEVVKRRRKVLHLSDSDGSDVMDFIVDEELLASVSGVMTSKRTEQAGAAGKMRSGIVLTTRDEVMLPAVQTTPPWLAPVTVAKSPYKGGILKPLATGEVVKRRRKVLHLSDSEGSDVMDFMVDEELLASVSGVMTSKRTEQAGAAGKMRSGIVLPTRDEVKLPAVQTAIEISALTGEVEQEMMASASPSIKLPAKQRYSPFDWFDSPDVDTTSESED
ncbi:golgin subfamily B member 1-like isoform X2 [Lethenteron reissneri]|uniref:golgin subfamily B member 1-like isoform X2 n=1 Tax=Lethenteron reissneri TaxID=7753 RepID=UPI002AB624AD|nr:golgin subfamily B member 1-like isoform X2 [Lethenteron reissneri]